MERLIGLAAVCRLCHDVFHWGLANIEDRFDRVKERLMAINRWDETDFASYHEAHTRRARPRIEVNAAVMGAHGPEPQHEAEELIRGIQAIAAQRSA